MIHYQYIDLALRIYNYDVFFSNAVVLQLVFVFDCFVFK